MHEKIMAEIKSTPFYQANFPNDGQRFVAWYLRRVLLLDEAATRAAITDGPGDKQIDAIVVEDGEERRIRVIQGKFVRPIAIDAQPLQEVLAAWTRLRDLPRLQLACSGKLAERLEAVRVALEEEYEVQFELLTTGHLTTAAQTDFSAFRTQMGDDADFAAGLTLVDSATLELRLAEAEQRDLPELAADLDLDPGRCLVTTEAGVRVVVTMLPIANCLKLPGIADGKLFRKNVRQSLGLSNKVNKALRSTLIKGEKAPYFFFFHNGITALCKKFEMTEDRKRLMVRDLAVVNGCQSLSTIYSTSGKVAAGQQGSVLFRLYEIPQRDLADEISINTNSQSAVKPRDLRSNDKHMLAIKHRYETAITDGYFITKRGEARPAAKDAAKCIDAPDYGKSILSWQCQRPNLASNEKRLFDEYYKTVFHPEVDAQSMLALLLWLGEIDKHWGTLDINDAIKAVKGSARFHVLFAVSQLFAHVSGQSDKVPQPAATMRALPHAGFVLNQVKGCLNQALKQAYAQAQAAGKIFSPQNWLKSKGAVSDEQLVTSAVVNVLTSMAGPDLLPTISSLTIPADKFTFRWSAD